MAKANLPVNFKDDILEKNMNGKRRFNMIQNSDGTVSFEDVTEYTQVGSTFGAAQINATNEAVNNAADASKIIDNLETIKANTQSGYIAGALAVKELNSNLKKIETGSVQLSTSTTTKVTLGYKPSLLFVIMYLNNVGSGNNAFLGCYYDSAFDTSHILVGSSWYTLPLNSSNNCVRSIDDDGFTMNKSSSATTYNYCQYYAVR